MLDGPVQPTEVLEMMDNVVNHLRDELEAQELLEAEGTHVDITKTFDINHKKSFIRKALVRQTHDMVTAMLENEDFCDAFDSPINEVAAGGAIVQALSRWLWKKRS